MRQDIESIIEYLKKGQLLRTQNGKVYSFISKSEYGAIVIDPETYNKFTIKGNVEILEDIDNNIIEFLEEEAVKDYNHTNEIKKMKKGQYFIGEDGREYIYIKFNNTRFTYMHPITKNKTSAYPKFIKIILDKYDNTIK